MLCFPNYFKNKIIFYSNDKNLNFKGLFGRKNEKEKKKKKNK